MSLQGGFKCNTRRNRPVSQKHLCFVDGRQLHFSQHHKYQHSPTIPSLKLTYHLKMAGFLRQSFPYGASKGLYFRGLLLVSFREVTVTLAALTLPWEFFFEEKNEGSTSELVPGDRNWIDFEFRGGERKWKIWSIPPRKLTWNLKMMVSNRNLLFQGFLFRFHVSFPGCSWRHPRSRSNDSGLTWPFGPQKGAKVSRNPRLF